jgi:four helix bundle protein
VRDEGKMQKFEDLVVWQKSHNLVLKIYKITKDFPDEEKFGLVSEMRRAAVSIAANIVEGFRKRSKKDKINFYNIAQSSSDELRYYVILTRDLGYLKVLSEEIYSQIDEIGKMLNGLIQSMGLRA